VTPLNSPHTVTSPSQLESGVFVTSIPVRVWPTDISPNLWKCFKHTSAYFSDDTVQWVFF